MQPHDLFGLGSLADLGARGGTDMRPTLLRVLTDLYVHRLSHPADEERHYTELALPMLDVVDVPTRIAVAKRFARYLSPPLRVLQRLARDVPDVATELRSHPLLQPPVPAVAAPQEVSATPHAGQHVPAQGERRAADPSHAIDAATAGELNDFFFAASAEERRLMLVNLEIVAPGPPARGRAAPDPTVGPQLEAAALSGKCDDFAHRLARSLQIPREQAHRIARDELGEPVVVAGKVLGIPHDALYRILMFVNPAVGHSVERVQALAALYDEISAAAAHGMLAIWQALHHQERPVAMHRLLVGRDETRQRARPGTAVQRNPAAARTGERRSAS